MSYIEKHKNTSRDFIDRQRPREDGRRQHVVSYVILFILAVFYYMQYYKNGFDLSDESSAFLMSKLILKGWLPYKELHLGYGPLWFYPISAVMAVFGSNFVLLKIYFFSIAAISGLLAYAIISNATRSALLSLAFSAIIILLPGVTWKAPVQLALFLLIYVFGVYLGFDRKNQTGRMVVAGLCVAAVYLVRQDSGFTMLCLLMLYPWLWVFCQENRRKNFATAARMVAVGGGAFIAALLPMIGVSLAMGFFPEFREWLVSPLKLLKIFYSGWMSVSQSADVPAMAGELLQRAPLGDLFGGNVLKATFVFFTYAPLAILALCAGYLSFAMYRELRSKGRIVNIHIWQRFVLFLAVVIPYHSFLLFRPDLAHFSQVMPSLLILLGVTMHDIVQGYLHTRNRMKIFVGSSAVASIIIVVILNIYLGFSYPLGNISIKKYAKTPILGKNGIDLFVRQKQHDNLLEFKKIVEDVTSEDDIVATFPYIPGYNVFVDRLPLSGRLYVDSSILISHPGWVERTIQGISRKRPKIIAISSMKINGTEYSMFYNWGKDVVDFIRQHYTRTATLGDVTVFLRNDLVGSGSGLAGPT